MNDKERAEGFLQELIQTKHERGIEYTRDHNKTAREQIEEIWRDEVKKKENEIVALLSDAIKHIANDDTASALLASINKAKVLIYEIEVDEEMRETIRHDIRDRERYDEVNEDKEELTSHDWDSFEKIIKMLSEDYLYKNKPQLRDKVYAILNRHSFDYLMR